MAEHTYLNNWKEIQQNCEEGVETNILQKQVGDFYEKMASLYDEVRQEPNTIRPGILEVHWKDDDEHKQHCERSFMNRNYNLMLIIFIL